MTARKSAHRFGPDTVPRHGAVVIIDESGFTRTMVEKGPQAALENIWRVRRVLVPSFRAHGGEVYKTDADNVYVFFHGADEALNASLGAHAVLERESRRARRELRVSIGIGFGELHYVTSEDDYYGLEVNLAAKLGEDIANGGQTLLTDAAYAALSTAASGRKGRRRRVTISGVKISYTEWLAD